MAYRFRERDGPIAAGRSLLLGRAALAAGELAQAGKLCGDREFRVSFARLRRVASARPAQSCEPAVIARAVYRLWDLRDPSFACGTGTNATFPLTPVIAPWERD